MKKQTGYILFTAAFLLLCLVPSVGMLLPERGGAGGNEVLAALPALRDGEGRLNGSYLTELADYAEDNYFLRQRLVTAWSALNQRALRTSTVEDVVLGKDGWLYFGGTLADYTGTDPMSAGEIAAAAHNLALVSEYCESRGAAFLFTAAPNKNSLYPRHMPGLPVLPGPRNADALAAALAEEGVAYCDLFAAFRAQEEELYFTQDSHWNSKGAALAADCVNAALGRRSDYFSGPFQPQAVHESDLYAMLYPAGDWLEEDQAYAGELSFSYESPVRSPSDLNIRTAGNGTGSLLLFRDSFGNLLYPYLADSFASAQFSRATAYRLDLIEERGADFVAVELVERNLRYLLQNVPVMPAPLRERAGDPLPLDLSVEVSGEEAANLPGYVLVQGRLPAEPDGGTAVYLWTAEGWYEAFRLEAGGFGLYVPADAGAAAVICTVNGTLVALSASWASI